MGQAMSHEPTSTTCIPARIELRGAGRVAVVNKAPELCQVATEPPPRLLGDRRAALESRAPSGEHGAGSSHRLHTRGARRPALRIRLVCSDDRWARDLTTVHLACKHVQQLFRLSSDELACPCAVAASGDQIEGLRSVSHDRAEVEQQHP